MHNSKVLVFVFVFLLVRLCLLITLIKMTGRSQVHVAQKYGFSTP